MDAFRSADEVLLNGVQGITDLITTPGLINVDFADVKGIMSGAGTALMGIGSLGDEVRVTVIAAGFDAGPGRKPVVGVGGATEKNGGGAHRIETAKAGKLTSTLFEP